MEKEGFEKVKKKISAFILEEDGKISKEAVITLGAILGTAALGAGIAGIAKGAPVEVSSTTQDLKTTIEASHSGEFSDGDSDGDDGDDDGW